MKLLLIFTLSLTSSSVLAQIGEPFPVLEKKYGASTRTWENISGLKEYVHPPVLDITINDFRPNVHIAGMNVIYFDDLIEEIISEFLGEEQNPVGQGNIMNPAAARGESLKRAEYINNAIYVFSGHWGGWHVLSHPAVGSITFNEDLTVAWVDYTMGYEGGQTTYQKQHGKWTFISSQATWME